MVFPLCVEGDLKVALVPFFLDLGCGCGRGCVKYIVMSVELTVYNFRWGGPRDQNKVSISSMVRNT